MRKRFLALFLTGLMTMSVLAGCSSKGKESSSKKDVEYSENIPEAIRNDKDGVKIMVIRKIGGDDHTAQYLAGAKKEGEAMGFTVDTYTANGDTAKFHDAINQAMEKGYDGVIISHGDDDATVEAVKKLKDKGIPVVTFDSNSEISNIDDVTVTSQDDEALAKAATEELVRVMGDEGKIAYLWVDGFPPMVSRNKVYTEFLREKSGITEIDRYGSANGDVSVQTQNAVSAMLTKYKKGDINGIFATWDAFAIGASRAIKEAGRDDVKMVGIDVSNADLQVMQEEGSPWLATAACDPRLIGALDVRIMAKKIAKEETPNEYKVAPTLITQEALKSADKTVNMDNLSEVIDGWGKSDEFNENWMDELREVHSK